MTEAGKTITRGWAKAFHERHGAVHETPHMRRLQDAEGASDSAFRRAMSRLPFDLFTVAVIHYNSDQIAKQKVREVSFIAGEEVTRREYWNRLDRVHHFAAGIEATLEQAREAPDDFLRRVAGEL